MLPGAEFILMNDKFITQICYFVCSKYHGASNVEMKSPTSLLLAHILLLYMNITPKNLLNFVVVADNR